MTLRRLAMLALLVTCVACGDEDPLGTVEPDVVEGADRIWEVAAADRPSAFDVLAGRRLFLGSGEVGAALGDVFLDSVGGELRLRPISGLVRLLAVHQVEIQDLGPVSFDTLVELPTDGYEEANDEDGVAVVQGHVYALRIRRSQLGDNFGAFSVDAVAGDPGARFVEFRYAAQAQLGNPRLEEE